MYETHNTTTFPLRLATSPILYLSCHRIRSRSVQSTYGFVVVSRGRILEGLGVPLYSGFMYASVASYLCQAWGRMDVQLVKWPSNWLVIPLGAAIYFNFFWHHFWMDVRCILAGLVILVFIQQWVDYCVREKRYRMPISFSFVLIGFIICVAENIATFYGAWQYPNQQETWSLVHIGKVSLWLLLIIVSFLLVAELKRVKVKAREDHV